MFQKQYDDAGEAYERAISVAPKQPDAYIALSRMWLLRADIDKAVLPAPANMKEGATVRAYDPVAMEEAAKLIPGMIPCKEAYDVAENADGLIIMTEWNQFRNLDLERTKSLLKSPVVVDLRNVYTPADMRAAGRAS